MLHISLHATALYHHLNQGSLNTGSQIEALIMKDHS